MMAPVRTPVVTPPKPMLVSYGREIARSDAGEVGNLYNRDWIFQHKYDGKRCLLRVSPKGTRAFSRSGKELKLTPTQASWTTKQATWYDGELVHMIGMRNETPWIVLFDVLDNVSFIVRYQRLENLLGDFLYARRITIGGVEKIVRNYWPAQSGFYTDGIIARRKFGTYQEGVRSPDVVKHKFTQITRCYVVSWEPGKNRHYGALNLALVRDGKPEYVGKVGTGFTEEQFKILISSKPFPEVEIKHLGFSPHGKLREPIFVRIV
jgi:ATP-dependent DNA ligase